MRSVRALVVVCVGLGCVQAGAVARADDAQLQLMRESIPFTSVVDAADGDDRFDIAAHVEFVRSAETGIVRRQLGGSTRPVAASTWRRSRLRFGLDLGLYKDLMATVRMPLTLTDERSLEPVSGRDPGAVQADLSDPAGPAGNALPLFALVDEGGAAHSFHSPTRAGLDYVGVGAAWGVLNQMRRPHGPTLVLAVEGRIAAGEPMHPCRELEDETRCGNEGTGDFGGRAGSSRGFHGVRGEVRTSRRYRHVEPYAGAGLLVQWPSKKIRDSFWPAGDAAGYAQRLPSRQVDTRLGAIFIPWESRAGFQRVGLDLELHATYVSTGHDYSALFDALGTSSHPRLATPLPGDDATSSGAAFYGLSDVQSHLRYGLRLGMLVRAAKYVRFRLGSRLVWVTDHDLTGTDPCPGAGPAGDAGCAAGAGMNPHHRAVIDLPGRRFRMTDQFAYDVHFAATASF